MSSKMKQFVKHQNPDFEGASQPNASAAAGDFQDFKVKIPPTGVTTKNRQTTVNGKQHNKPVSQQEGNHETEHPPFWATGSSLGEPSEASAPELKDEPLSQSMNPNHYPHEDYHGMPDRSEGEDQGEERAVEDEDEVDENLPENPLQEEPEIFLNKRQQQIMQSMDLQRRPAPSFPYSPGDSYPSTTSGNPSVDELVEARIVPRRSAPKSQNQHQIRPTTSQQGLKVQRQSHGEAQHTRGLANGGHATQAKRGIEEVTTHDPAADFSFYNPHQAPKSLGPPLSQPPPSSNAVEPSTLRPTSFSSNPVHYPAEGALQLTRDKKTLPVRDNQDTPKALTNPGWPNAGAPQVINPALHYQRISNGNGNRVGTGTPLQAHEREQGVDALDYETTKLFNMDYATLKSQSFDSDPNAREFKFPPGHSTSTLNDKLKVAETLDKNSQARFFASLPINEWEEAGDWFLTRFGDMLTKLKANRQEKREAAKVFENEIENRHIAVSKKRKQTEEELAGMKQSGVKVLERTPKKTKTTGS